MTLKEAIEPFMADPEDIAFNVSDLLDAMADHYEKHEPYAIHAIKRLRDCANDMSDLLDMVEKDQ